MSILWQNIAIGAAVAAAIGYLTVYYVRRKKRADKCSSCTLLKRPQETIRRRS